MTNEQLALLVRGYQYRLRNIICKMPMIDARKLMEEFDNDLTRDILDLLRIERKGD